MSALAATLMTTLGVIGRSNRFSNKLLGDNSISFTTPKLKYLYLELNDINLRPIYQRDIRWTLSKMSVFLSTIMNGGIVPEILLYKLHSDESNEYKYECIDGQHRLFVISHFRSGEYVKIPGKTPFLIYIEFYNEDTKQTEHLFYEKNDATEDYKVNNPSKIVSYLTKEEKNDFDDFVLNVKTITKPLHINSRREIFTSLQNGIPVRNSDALKNYTRHSFIQYLSDANIEQKMRELINNNCTKKADKFWIQWVVKFWYFINNFNNKTPTEIFTKYDGEIGKIIKTRNHPLLETTPELLDNFENAFNRFYNFCRSTENRNIKVNPTIFFALFAHLMNGENNREEILNSYLPFISKNGMDKVYKNIWEKHDIKFRSEYFETVLSELESCKTIKTEIERPAISQSLKKKVWEKEFNDMSLGNCRCGVELNKTGDWHAGHIIPWCKGGETTIDNLLPICGPCNLEMGRQNLYDFFENKI
jgi:hypothetical protein